jgi:hypothetical protein
MYVFSFFRLVKCIVAIAKARCPAYAVEQIRHLSDSQGRIIALACSSFLVQIFKLVQAVPSSLGSVGGTQTLWGGELATCEDAQKWREFKIQRSKSAFVADCY